MPRLRSRLAFLVAALAFLWVAAFLGLSVFADGCGLEHVLPWYDPTFNVCNR